MSNSTLYSNCRICGSSNLVKALSLCDTPISERYLEDQSESLLAERFSLDIYQCCECLLLQQIEVVDPDDLWSEYSYFSGQTPNMCTHFQEEFKEISSLLTSYGLTNHSVLEIGSNDGSFLDIFRSHGWNVLGVDPAKYPVEVAQTKGIPSLCQPFTSKLANSISKNNFTDSQYSLVLMYNAFAHIHDVHDILKGVNTIIGSESPGLFRFEVQYAKALVDSCLIPSIFHEHISHYSLASLSRLLHIHGLSIINVRLSSIQHGSLIVTAVQSRFRSRFELDNITRSIFNDEATSGSVYLPAVMAMQDRLQRKKVKINHLLESYESSGLKITAFGAARSSSTILTNLAISRFIKYVYDDADLKVGKFIYGEGIPIVSSSMISSNPPDVIVILAWVHSKFIISRLSDFISSGGVVISLFPDLEIISQSGHTTINC